MGNVLVPELAVSDWQASREFYCDLLGFSCRYAREEEGFCYLEREGAEIMLDQIGAGRDFDGGHLPETRPFGRGVNLQIEVSDLGPILAALEAARVDLFLGPEEKWYRIGDEAGGNRQIVVADPDGYLLRFFEDLGRRPA
ncbi:Catechol 2,3-dioxygenase [Pseudooceanicola antarcticus]|uniref:Bleomycin resistance protein n=1 Tax=Pseudooceanicola antarcticus TaxID=1247613 RepID=A0A285IIP6_9RHOB|nr:VOC family protein [Pseudooceanicola antarcticus]PJE29085.1 VOC family protein [Pseudooceanicola antarcticus]SNY46821.1 Catechol 2,3-dioxygenase [Pseudooceanicola antarcticus]